MSFSLMDIIRNVASTAQQSPVGPVAAPGATVANYGQQLLDYIRSLGRNPAAGQTPQGEQSEQGATPTPAPVQTPGIANTPAVAQRPQPQRPQPEPVAPAEQAPPPNNDVANPRPVAQNQGLLDVLRERVRENVGNERMSSVNDIGIGMLNSRSPNFFSMLGAGLAAQSAGQRQRAEELRQAVDSERQAAQVANEDAYRREQTRISQQRYDQEAPLRAAQAAQANAMARYYAAGGAGAFRTPTNAGQLTPAVMARLSIQARQRAQAALQADPTLRPEDADRLYQQFLEEAIASAMFANTPPAGGAGGAGGTPTPPQQPNIPTITPAGRPAR